MRWLKLGYEKGRTIERVRAKLNEEGRAWWRNRTETKGGGDGVENRSEQGGMENSKNLHHNRG